MYGSGNMFKPPMVRHLWSQLDDLDTGMLITKRELSRNVVSYTNWSTVDCNIAI